MLTKTWKITSVQVRPQLDTYSNVVSVINWMLSVSNGTQVLAGQAGATQLGSPSSTSYVDYTTLTEAQLIDWIKTTLGADKVAECERFVENQAMSMISPVVNKVAPPWAGYTFNTVGNVQNVTVTKDVAVTPFTPIGANGGAAPLMFTVQPPLPEGLAMDSTTGLISGTPIIDLTAALPNYISVTNTNVRTFTVEIVDTNLVVISNTFTLTQG